MVSNSSIRVDSYAAIRGYINSALSDASITGVSVVTSFPKSNSDLPAVVLPMQTVRTERTSIGGTGTFTGAYRIEAPLDVYTTAEASEGPARIAAVLDAIQDYLETTDLSSDNLVYEMLDASDITRFEHNEQTLYNAGIILMFTLTA